MVAKSVPVCADSGHYNFISPAPLDVAVASHLTGASKTENYESLHGPGNVRTPRREFQVVPARILEEYTTGWLDNDTFRGAAHAFSRE